MIGGRDAGLQGLSSVEVIGLENCTVPDLPEWRYNHGSFVTEWGSLAVCGGWWEGKPLSSDCLVLNRTSQLWERDILSEVFGNTVLGVIRLDVGTYLVHPTTSSPPSFWKARVDSRSKAFNGSPVCHRDIRLKFPDILRGIGVPA